MCPANHDRPGLRRISELPPSSPRSTAPSGTVDRPPRRRAVRRHRPRRRWSTNSTVTCPDECPPLGRWSSLARPRARRRSTSSSISTRRIRRARLIGSESSNVVPIVELERSTRSRGRRQNCSCSRTRPGFTFSASTRVKISPTDRHGRRLPPLGCMINDTTSPGAQMQFLLRDHQRLDELRVANILGSVNTKCDTQVPALFATTKKGRQRSSCRAAEGRRPGRRRGVPARSIPDIQLVQPDAHDLDRHHDDDHDLDHTGHDARRRHRGRHGPDGHRYLRDSAGHRRDGQADDDQIGYFGVISGAPNGQTYILNIDDDNCCRFRRPAALHRCVGQAVDPHRRSRPRSRWTSRTRYAMASPIATRPRALLDQWRRCAGVRRHVAGSRRHRGRHRRPALAGRADQDGADGDALGDCEGQQPAGHSPRALRRPGRSRSEIVSD